MKLIDPSIVLRHLESFTHQPIYFHIETTNGAYAAHRNDQVLSAGTFLRNIPITYQKVQISHSSPLRIGFQIEKGWMYVEGITNYDSPTPETLLLGGYDGEGKLAISCQISTNPFPFYGGNKHD
jgi:hypothetical protein